MGSKSYVKIAIKNIKARLTEDGYKFNSKLSSTEYSVKQPFSAVDYRPELDTSAECNDNQMQLYQNPIRVLMWIVKLDRIDIAYETSVLSNYYLAYPRTGHLNQALHMFKYLDLHCSNELKFDPKEYIVDDKSFNEAKEKMKAMASLYIEAKEEIPPNAPKPRGRAIQINCFVDSDHAGDEVTRRSHTGILMHRNAPISWYSKKQATVESSTYRSEFVALRITSEQIISLRYKLHMFRIPIDGYANTFCDKESVFKNASFAESQLKNKHNSICFHQVRECVASMIMMSFKVDTKFNLSDILTKSLASYKRLALRKLIMPSHGTSMFVGLVTNIPATLLLRPFETIANFAIFYFDSLDLTTVSQRVCRNTICLDWTGKVWTCGINCSRARKDWFELLLRATNAAPPCLSLAVPFQSPLTNIFLYKVWSLFIRSLYVTLSFSFSRRSWFLQWLTKLLIDSADVVWKTPNNEITRLRVIALLFSRCLKMYLKRLTTSLIFSPGIFLISKHLIISLIESMAPLERLMHLSIIIANVSGPPQWLVG